MKTKIGIVGLSGESIFMNVKRFPTPGETIHADDVFIEPGGKGYNQAVAAKRLGADVYFFSCVGDDQYGRFCEEELKKEGINTYFLYKKNKKTPIATILTNEESLNEVIVSKGAMASLTVDDILPFEKVIKEMDVLLLQLEIPYSILEKIVDIANKYNVKIILNPAPMVYDLKYILKNVDIITPNETEACQLFKVKSIKDINIKEIKKAVITLGEAGSLIIEDGKCQHIKACDVEAIDTTGAGDVFNAALAVKYKEYKSLKEIVKFATLASSKSVTKRHVIDSIPYLEELNNCK